MNFRGAIFDLDGVLVDTVPLHFIAWRRLFEHYGYEFGFDDYKSKVDGKPRIEGIKAIITDASDELVQEASDRKQSYYVELLKRGQLEATAPAVEFIEHLKTRHVRLAVASSSRNTRFVLETIGLLDKFAAVVTVDDVDHGKPHPDMFLRASEQLGLDVRECVVFEDAESGVQAAKRGGFVCAGIDFHDHQHYFDAADIVVRNISELNFELLQSLLTRVHGEGGVPA